jgi:hypothetical protein
MYDMNAVRGASSFSHCDFFRGKFRILFSDVNTVSQNEPKTDRL